MLRLSAKELAAKATALLAQAGRSDLRISYGGNNWYNRHCVGMGYPTKERRADIERMIAGLEQRIAKEASEAPERERIARENEARNRLLDAAPDLLEALKATYNDPADVAYVPNAIKHQARAAIAKAEEGIAMVASDVELQSFMRGLDTLTLHKLVDTYGLDIIIACARQFDAKAGEAAAPRCQHGRLTTEHCSECR